MTDLISSVKAIRAEADNYTRAAGYYHGAIGELFTSEPVRRALKGSVGGFDVNLARRHCPSARA